MVTREDVVAHLTRAHGVVFAIPAIVGRKVTEEGKRQLSRELGKASYKSAVTDTHTHMRVHQRLPHIFIFGNPFLK